MQPTAEMHPNSINMSAHRCVCWLVLLAAALITVCAPARVAALANCPIACECDDDTLVVRCGEGALDVLPIALNPSIQRLSIKNNKIKTIDSALQFYAELRHLDLSYNHLFNIPPGTFNYQRKLTELHLNHNKIGLIGNTTFAGLAALTVLNLHGNFLDELGAGVFSTLPRLEQLNIGQNRIARVDALTFVGLNALRVLYLDDNSLTSVPSDAFAHVPVLAELYLGLNSFTAIAAGSFGNLHALTTLRLNGASLFNVSAATFAGLENVRRLDLSDNRLQRIPTVELARLVRLEELSLGQNDFPTVPPGSFDGLANLRRIDISGSLKLAQLQAGAFAGNSIESITVAANNALNDVQAGAFGALPKLRHVVLRGNALSTLPEGLFAWSQLQTLDVSENPLLCDCRLIWLRSALLANRSALASTTSSSTDVKCEAPEQLRNQRLTVVSEEALGCAHAGSQRQALLGVVLVSIAAVLTALLLIAYKCRRYMRELLKGRWGSSALGRKEREYQKTFSDEEYMAAAAAASASAGSTSVDSAAKDGAMHALHHHHHQHRPVPVTEL